jgi:hypothetical protein
MNYAPEIKTRELERYIRIVCEIVDKFAWEEKK